MMSISPQAGQPTCVRLVPSIQMAGHAPLPSNSSEKTRAQLAGAGLAGPLGVAGAPAAFAPQPAAGTIKSNRHAIRSGRRANIGHPLLVAGRGLRRAEV
jgi:hypothetical protein